SLKVITGYVEPGLRESKAFDHFQFQRLGYFCVDRDATEQKPVFNKTVGLRDTWAKIENKES
ncbi:MAG TPA: glutamine--tRNA ligase, partial [Flavobacterium sp.]